MRSFSPFFKINPGGGGHTPQTKEVDITENGQLVINADEGYDCLSSVTANVNVPSSGEGGGKDVTFIDFDGDVLYSYTKEEAMALSALPDPPDHSGDDIPLVFDRWNYTLEDIQEELEDTGKAAVGANYHTSDGFTHLVWKVKAGEQVRIASISSGATINWGDGETTTGQTSAILHTYTNAGVYDCKVSGTSIVVGNSATSLRKNLSRLYEVRLPQGVTSIGGSAFNSCSSLQSVSIPQSVTSIGSNAFNNCYSLQSITIPQGVTSIAYGAFPGCNSLQNVSIPQGVTSIGSSAFSSCYLLRSVSIPQSVTSIGSNAFQNCYSLKSVTIPQSVTGIESSAFSSCTSLKSVVIPQKVTSLGSSAFSSCYLLRSVVILQGVTSIGQFAFNACYSLNNISMPQSVTSIRNYAFQNCYPLQSITIPQGVTTIGEFAFDGCYFETLVFESAVPPTVGSTSSFPSTNIKKIVVPKGSLEAYQNATNLSQMASKMVEADE